jgi:hypothetical protein
MREMLDIAPAVSNNYYIRTLLGHSVFVLPVGAVTREHLELAKLKLHQFDILLMLEQVGSHSPRFSVPGSAGSTQQA